MTPVLWMALGAVLAWLASFALFGTVMLSSWLHERAARRALSRGRER